MTIDLSQFYQVFFDETAEHLALMESLLLGIDPATASSDDLNAIFRAAHSMKGGAGTFGFTDMTDVTHVLETLLDRVRKNEMALTPEMVDAFLQAGDVIKAQLDAHRAGDRLADTGPALAVCARLAQLTQGSADSSGAAPAATDAQVAAAPAGLCTYAIAFGAKGQSQAVATLLENLRAVGTLEIVAQPQPREPGTAAKRAKSSCNWALRLVTAATETQIRELFDFIKLAGALAITQQEAAPDAPRTAEADDAGYGFFDTAAGAPPVDADPGYGFFTDLAPAAPSAPAPSGVGRRATDPPAVLSAVGGRRESDKVVVAPQAEASSIRVSVEKVDQLINLVGELVITQAMLAQNASRLDPGVYEKLINGMAQFERNTRDLQESVMSIRMMPISFVFSRFPRVVRDLAGKLNKQVELKTEGEATELDKAVIEKLADPLTHLVRNSLDHGVELPAVREAAGKPAKGTITLRAFHRGGNIMVEVVDDGAGLDRERLLAKARERGMSVTDAMSDHEVFQLIFEAGFSTAAVITDVSGRGVGMDVVRRNIREMGGHVEITSALGIGTRISIRLPLTLAILDGMSVGVGREVFIIPLTYITESLQPAPEHVKTITGQGRVVQVRGEYLPVVALHETFKLKPKVTEFHRGIMVILEADGAKTALFVDELLGQHQVVIKSLETNYRRVQGVSGATIMGDGRVALILDVAGLVTAAQNAYANAA
jgi:two-component system chemotaxis sensor kinase CheA